VSKGTHLYTVFGQAVTWPFFDCRLFMFIHIQFAERQKRRGCVSFLETVCMGTSLPVSRQVAK